MKNSQKGFIAPLLLALIALLLIGGGVYVYMQKKQANQSAAVQTSDLKTYTNTEYGFEFKYSSAWSLGEITGNALKINLPNEYLKDYPYTMVVKWYRNYQDVGNGFKYNVQLKRWGYILQEQPGDNAFYGPSGAPSVGDFRELDKLFSTETGISVYCLGNEGGASHLIPLSDNTFIVMENVGIGCRVEGEFYKFLQSFRPIL